MTHHDAAAQDRTIATAVRSGTHWTQAELDKLAERSEVQIDEVTAVELGRTLYAVRDAKQNLTERLERAAATRGYVKGGTARDNIGFTSLEAMGF